MTRRKKSADLGKLDRDLRKLERSTWCPHTPSEKQRKFLDASETLEALYGGAAGGGKSDALLMGALEYANEPGYSAIIFRRSFTDLNLPDSLMARSHEWLDGTKAKWNGSDRCWTFPSGAKLQFAYLATEQDKYRYQGAAFQYIAFDELTQFDESQYLYLLSRLRRRRGMQHVPLRMRAGSNPGNAGHVWVKKRFIDDAVDRVFVPARLEDNPHLDQESYRKSLAHLPEVLRRQLENGEWVQDGSGLLYRADPDRTYIKEDPGVLDYYVLALDFGVTAENAVAVMGWRKHEDTVYVKRAYKLKGSPSLMGEEVAALEALYKFDAIVGDVGGLGKAFQIEIEQRFKVPIEPADKNNKLGYVRLLNDALERGKIKVVRSACEDLRTEWSALQRLADGREVPGQSNHASDAVLYGWRKCGAFAERPRRTTARLTQEQLDEQEAALMLRTMRGDDDRNDEEWN